MNDQRQPQTEFILYQTDDDRTRGQCRFEEEMLWLTQALIADPFQTTPQNVTLHLKAIFPEGELVEVATCKDHLQVRLKVSELKKLPQPKKQTTNNSLTYDLTYG